MDILHFHLFLLVIPIAMAWGVVAHFILQELGLMFQVRSSNVLEVMIQLVMIIVSRQQVMLAYNCKVTIQQWEVTHATRSWH